MADTCKICGIRRGRTNKLEVVRVCDAEDFHEEWFVCCIYCKATLKNFQREISLIVIEKTTIDVAEFLENERK